MDPLTASFYLALLVLGASAQKELEKPSKQASKDDGRIIGGKETDIEKFPYMVSLQFARNGRHFCGGSIISPDFILTAAHCVREDRIPSDKIQIVAGTTNLKNETEQTEKRKIEAVIIHPDYCSKTRDSDVALIRLDAPLELGGNIKAVRLDRNEMSVPDYLVIAGWGMTTNKTKEPSDVLKATAVPGVSRDTCRRRFKNSNTAITNNMICAGFDKGGTDACKGDSGGPVISYNTKKQVGVVSWGKGCAKSHPAVHANVAKFIPWIRSETGLSL